MISREIKVIAFDADDTLWINEYHYRNAEHQFVDMMLPYSNEAEAIESLLIREKANLPLLGYGSKPFIISLLETAILLSKGAVTSKEISKLIEIGKTTIGEKIELLPNVPDVLDYLYGKYPLLLATKGDLKEQEMKIAKSGLSHYFDEVVIVSEKSNNTYLEIIKNRKIDSSHFLMVGNSFKSDIAPVLEIGGFAIYIPAELTWAHEVIAEFDHPNLIKAAKLETRLFAFDNDTI